MAKMSFAKKVKYLGTTYPANTAIEVKDEDIQNLKNAGGWLMQESKGTTEGGQDEDTNDSDKKPADDGEWSLEELKEIATSLGIKVKGNWGKKKLTEVIAEAQK